MIEAAIKEIRDAEFTAEQMQKEAYQKGKQLVLDAEAEADKQKRMTMQECKEQRKAAYAEARKTAEERTQAILNKGEEDADALIEQTKPAVLDAANKVVAALIAKYDGDKKN